MSQHHVLPNPVSRGPNGCQFVVREKISIPVFANYNAQILTLGRPFRDSSTQVYPITRTHLHFQPRELYLNPNPPALQAQHLHPSRSRGYLLTSRPDGEHDLIYVWTIG